MQEFEITKTMLTTIKVGGAIEVEYGRELDRVEVHTFIDEAGTEWPSTVAYFDYFNNRLYPSTEDLKLIEDHFIDLALGATV